MSNGQWTVLSILLTAFGVQVVFSPLTKSAVYNIATGLNPFSAIGDKSTPIADQLAAPAVGIVMYIIGIAVFLTLADVLPKIMTWIAILILTLAILSHAKDISTVITVGNTGIAQLRGGK